MASEVYFFFSGPPVQLTKYTPGPAFQCRSTLGDTPVSMGSRRELGILFPQTAATQALDIARGRASSSYHSAVRQADTLFCLDTTNARPVIRLPPSSTVVLFVKDMPFTPETGEKRAFDTAILPARFKAGEGSQGELDVEGSWRRRRESNVYRQPLSSSSATVKATANGWKIPYLKFRTSKRGPYAPSMVLKRRFGPKVAFNGVWKLV
ncbi:hypothetical protein CPC08DRAFT_730731 [Agrocybe pediades]|nr:hypothetical protein CPC08DRAFT_730731 [Agrocybe pediades]